MKKILFVLVILALCAVGWFFGRGVNRPERSEKINVVVSGYVPYTLAKELGGDKIALTMLLPVNAEPHSFEPAPGALITVGRADVFVYVSPRLEPWAEDILSGAGRGVRAIKLADWAAASEDPHIWMNFENVRRMAGALSEVFVQADPGNAGYYADRLAAFQTRLDALDGEFQSALQNCRSREVVHVGHLAFKNLTDRYGLSLAALAGASHDGEHSVRKLAGLVKLIRDGRVSTIFTEETLSPRLSAAVAEETGAQILPLYTVEHVSREDFDAGVTYEELMRRNLESLVRGLGCRA